MAEGATSSIFRRMDLSSRQAVGAQLQSVAQSLASATPEVLSGLNAVKSFVTSAAGALLHVPYLGRIVSICAALYDLATSKNEVNEQTHVMMERIGSILKVLQCDESVVKMILQSKLKHSLQKVHQI